MTDCVAAAVVMSACLSNQAAIALCLPSWLQRLPRSVVLRHRVLPRRLAGGAPPHVPGAWGGTGGSEGGAAAGGGSSWGGK